MPKLNIQDKLTINSAGILELNGNPYVDFNAAGQLTLGNQNWLPLCGDHFYTGQNEQTDSQGTSSSISFDHASGGMKFVGQGVAIIQTRIPVDKFSKYRVKIRVKKTVEAKNTVTVPSSYADRDFLYCGVVSVDADFREIMLDGADLGSGPGNPNYRSGGGDRCSTYNYGTANAVKLYTDGATAGGNSAYGGGSLGNSEGEYSLENIFSGFNLQSENDHTKFDPTTSYFNIVIICNYLGFNYSSSDLVEATKGETIIQNVEVERISSWGGNSSDSPADTPSYFSNFSQNYYPGSRPDAFTVSADPNDDLDGLIQMVGRGAWVDSEQLSGSGDGRGWAFWPSSGQSHPTLYIQEQKSKAPGTLGKPGNMNYSESDPGEKRLSSHNIPLFVNGSYLTGNLLIGSNHPVARFQQNYQVAGRPSPNGDYIDINIVGDAASASTDYAGMAVESGWGNLFLGARNVNKQSHGGTAFPELATGPRNEWGMIIDMNNLVHIGIPSGVGSGNWTRMDSAYGKEALNLHGAAKFTSIIAPRAGPGSEGAGTLWWRDDIGPGAFYYRATDGTDKVLGNGDVTFNYNYSGTLWQGYNADRIGTDQTVFFTDTSLDQLATNPQYYYDTAGPAGMALGCSWGQADGITRPAIQILSSADSGWAAIYLNSIDYNGSNDGRYMQFATNGANHTTFRPGGGENDTGFLIESGSSVSIRSKDVGIGTSGNLAQWGTLQVDNTKGDGAPTIDAWNQSTNSENAHAIIRTAVKPGGGDAYYRAVVDGELEWSFGLDSSDENKFKINSSGELGNVLDRLTITGTGEVGIGTTSPEAKLHVDGHSRFSDGQAYFFRTSASAAPFYAHQKGTGPSGYFMGGNVGIGTTSPSANLSVIGTSLFQRDIETPGPWTTTIVLRNESKVDGISMGLDFQSLDSTDTLRTTARIGNKILSRGENQFDSVLTLTANGSKHDDVVITSDGYVGIGTNSPAGMLDIQTETTDAVPIRAQSMHPNQTALRLTNGTGNTASSWTMMSKSHGDLIGPN